jgi:hypothetical protein
LSKKRLYIKALVKTLVNLPASIAIFQSIYSAFFCLMPELEKAGVYDLGLRIALGNE